MRIGAFEIPEPLPELDSPHALAMLRPWIDVGSVGALTLVGLETALEAKELTSLVHPGTFFDFTRYRPTLYFREGRRHMSTPNTSISYARTGTGRDFVFLKLLEPHMRSEIYVDSVVKLLGALGVERYCLLGSMYDVVPHTRKLLVSGGAMGQAGHRVVKTTDALSSDYQGPTSIALLINREVADSGMESMWFIVHLPQYAEIEENYLGKVRLMEVLESLYGFSRDEADAQKAGEQVQSIDSAVDENPELKAILPHIEASYQAKLDRKAGNNPPSLSADTEEFLRGVGGTFVEGEYEYYDDDYGLDEDEDEDDDADDGL